MRKFILITGSIFFAAMLIIAGVVWYWNTHKKQIIQRELEKKIQEKSQGLYAVHYDDLQLDEINGSLSVSSFILAYDSVKYSQLKNSNKAPYVLFHISIPHISVSGVKTPRALLENELTGRSLILSNPVIEILYTHAGKDSSRTIPGKEIYEQILGNLTLIKIDSVIISGAEIITKNLKTGKSSIHFLNTSLLMKDVQVDSIANADTMRLLFAKEINLTCEKLSWQSPDKRYNYRADSLSIVSSASGIKIKNFWVLPLLTEDKFARSIPFQNDRFDFAVHNMEFKNVNFCQLINSEVIKADTLYVGPASFKLYRDRNFPKDNKSKVGTYPQQIIQKLPVQIEISNMMLQNAFIQYKEKNPKTRKTGIVQFRNLFINVNNITNRKEAIGRNSSMVAYINTLFIYKIPLYVKWTFYLGNPDGRFAVEGKMGSTFANVFNAAAQPLGPARFEKGFVNSLAFNMTGNNYQIKGKVELLYNDLHVSLLKKNEDSTTFSRRKLISLFANMKIINDNPSRGKEARTAAIDFKRDIHTSIFNFAWKSLYSGIKEITGAK